MKKLPIGIASFSEIIREDCYYVDKTRYVHELAEAGKYYFLLIPSKYLFTKS